MKHHLIRSTVFALSSITLACSLGCATDTYAQGYGYYPHYNPVVRRDYYRDGGYAPDGTYHSEDLVEDRRASYYSPGRNRAITRPRTTVESWSDESGRQTTREHTKWIGADGKPHSTTIQRDTITDEEGNSHTDTHVTLRKANKKVE